LEKTELFQALRAEFPGVEAHCASQSCYAQALGDHCANAILATRKPWVTIPGHRETRMRLALVTRATHASHRLIVARCASAKN